MAEVSFNTIFLTSVVLYFQLEFFFYLCYNNLVFFNKVAQITKSNQINNSLASVKNIDFLYILVLFLFLFLSKGVVLSLLGLLVFFLYYTFKLSKLTKHLHGFHTSNNSIQLVLFTFFTFFYFLFFVKSFLTLFFFIELYGVLYYFFFLTNYNLTSQTVLKYKNAILLLLWNNFLTTFFLALGCFYISKTYGTTSFNELSTITVSTPYIYIFLLGLSWKLGLPIFHFFKIEVYKFLLKENVFMFSILTTLINILILYVCLTQSIVFNTIYLFNTLAIVMVFVIFLILTNLKLSNILQFFAVSSILTLATVLSLFLV